MLVAALAAGCSKEEINNGSASSGTRNNVMRIFAGSFQNDSKVTYDPASVNAVNWVDGELISLSWGNVEHYYDIEEYEEAGSNPGDYCINFGETSYPFPSGNIYAIYPASYGLNNVDVTNEEGNREIVLNNLVIKGTGGNSEMAFPMAASTNYDGTNTPSLVFKHLSAGFRVRLSGTTNPSTSALNTNLKKLRIVALSNDPVVNHGIELGGKNITAKWASEGDGTSLVLPAGPVGSNDEDVVVANYSEMNFTVDETAIAGNSEDGYSMDFCIPVTITKFRSLVIVGYAENGTVLFKKTTNFASERTIERNHMYTLPVINL